MEFNNDIEVVEVKKLTMVEKFKYFFINPNKLFEDYNVKPAWLLKTLFIVVISLIAVIITTQITAGPQTDLLLQRSPDMSREQAEAIIKSPFMMYFTIAAGFIVPILAIFLGSLIYWGLLSLFGGKTSYTKIVSVYTLAYIPYLVGSFISLAFAYYANNFDNMLQPQIKDVLFTRFDLFVIWQALLLVFGLAKISGLKPQKTAIIVAIMWILATGAGIIQALLGKAS